MAVSPWILENSPKPAPAYLEDPDVQRMLRLREGDMGAFDELLVRHRRRVIHTIYCLVRDTNVAEDLAQEVFLRVYRARDRYTPTASFSTWLYRIATNRARNWLRDHAERYRRESPLENGESSDRPRQWVDPGLSVEEMLLRQDSEKRLRLLVETLPDRQREAVLLHKFADMPYGDLARTLGCTVPALKSLLFRAYAALRLRMVAEAAGC